MEVKNNPDKYASLIADVVKRADKALSEGPWTVTGKSDKFVSDVHDYASIGPYWWPDPKNPGGPYIRKDGIVNPEYHEYDSEKLGKLEVAVKYLALAYCFTDNKLYRDTMLDYVRVWFIKPSTRMNPNFDHGQIVPNMNNNAGRPFGLIEALSFTQISEAMELVDGIRKVDGKTMKAYRRWCREFADWMMNSEIGRQESEGKNNHGLAYDVTLTRFLLECGDNAAADKVMKEFRTRRLEPQIMEDGSMPQELARTRALHYSLYNLTHIIDFCIFQESRGIHYYAENKEIIDRCFKYLLPYIGHKENFQYKDIRNEWAKGERWLCQQLQRLRRLSPADNDAFDFSRYPVKDFGSAARLFE